MNLPEQSIWENGVYQLEIDDQVLGGPGEIDNRQATELGNRTRWLKDQLPGKSDVGHNHDADYSAVGHNHDAVYATPAYVDSKATPAGAVLAWPTEVEPAGFLPCEGAAVPRDTYAALFAIIGTTYGIGNGATTFNLPDLRGQFLRGWDHAAGVDPDAGTRTDRGDGTIGDQVGTVQLDELKSHRHSIYGYGNAAEAGLQWNGIGSGEGAYIAEYAGDPVQLTGGAETRPVNKSVLFVIKY